MGHVQNDAGRMDNKASEGVANLGKVFVVRIFCLASGLDCS